MKYLEFSFENKIIRGFFEDVSKKNVVIMVHGFMGNKSDHHFMMRNYSNAIVKCGFSTYRFDFLGSGDSDGTFEECESIHYQIKQLSFLIKKFKEKNYCVHIFAFSLGGVIATQCEGYESLFLLSPAGNFKNILRGFMNLGKPYNEGYEFNGFCFSEDLIKEVESFDCYSNVMERCPTKIVQGTLDQYVSLDSFNKYCELLNAESYLIEGADHCYSDINHTIEVEKELVKFYGKVKKESY